MGLDSFCVRLSNYIIHLNFKITLKLIRSSKEQFEPVVMGGNIPSNVAPLWMRPQRRAHVHTWCVQVLRSPKEASVAAMQSWRERCEKCVCLQGDYVEK